MIMIARTEVSATRQSGIKMLSIRVMGKYRRVWWSLEQ